MNNSPSIKGFQFTPTGIAGILKANRLRVPPYQREYAWTTDEVGTLYNDYTRAKNENADYFLGTIVTIKGNRSEPLSIVDGQQRLTSTALLIAAIRDYLGALGQPSNVLESINNDYLSSFDRKQNCRICRLTLNIDDHSFFESMIDRKNLDPTRESHRRLLSAQKAANEHVKSIVRAFSSKDQPSILNDWLEFLEHSATVILVETQNGSQAFKMFETLNDRGLKTSQADLVKSYLFGQSGSRISEAQTKWSSMKETLEEIDDDDRAINFLRHSIIATRKFVRAEDVYEYSQSVRGENNSVAFLAELERLARIYVATYHPTSAHWEGYPASAQRALSTFNKFDVKPIRPIVLSLAISFGKAEFANAMVLLVSIVVRLVTAGSTRSGTLENAISTTSARIYSGEIASTKDLKDSLKAIIISDSDFQDGFASLRVSRADLARYYLQTLEAANAGEHEPWYVPNDDPAVMTLEHVMPSNATNDIWPDIDDEMKSRCVKRLGNMCMLNKSANNVVGNAAFSVKRPVLANAPYLLTNEIGRELYWDFGAIERRQTRLARLAVSAWPV
jgi:hypothetical protein